MLRLASWIGAAGGGPVRVSAGAPGSRPQSRGEIPAAERGVESLVGGSKRGGWDCSVVTVTIGEPSRSCHDEGHVRQSHSAIGRGGSPRGRETCTRARSDHRTGEARLASLVSDGRPYQPMAKSSGGQRESEGVVVVQIGVQSNASEAKAPCFDRACRRRVPGHVRAFAAVQPPDGRWPVVPSASDVVVLATCRSVALAGPRRRLSAAARRPQGLSWCANRSRRVGFPRAARLGPSRAGRVAASGRSSVSVCGKTARTN
jgi:hypothetical protein